MQVKPYKGGLFNKKITNYVCLNTEISHIYLNYHQLREAEKMFCY